MKINWMHFVIVAMLVFISSIFYVMYRVGQRNSDLVSDNYYEDTLVYQKVIDAKKNADTLTVKPILDVKETGIQVEFPEGFSGETFLGLLSVQKATGAQFDVEIPFRVIEGQKTVVEIPREKLSSGRYQAKLFWKDSQKEYQIEKTLQWK
ncbi:MAG: hypothetical protein C4K58_04800 [Flavobacteriaceae bacterium]|nr:MAG: hypothetical protein C4K58_04800 [Flavobacteriaceae bacterium]